MLHREAQHAPQLAGTAIPSSKLMEVLAVTANQGRPILPWYLPPAALLAAPPKSPQSQHRTQPAGPHPPVVGCQLGRRRLGGQHSDAAGPRLPNARGRIHRILLLAIQRRRRRAGQVGGGLRLLHLRLAAAAAAAVPCGRCRDLLQLHLAAAAAAAVPRRRPPLLHHRQQRWQQRLLGNVLRERGWGWRGRLSAWCAAASRVAPQKEAAHALSTPP